MKNLRFKKKYFIQTFLLLVAFLGQQDIFALTSSDIPIPTQISGLDEQVDITSSPKFPKPGDTVTITLEAYGIDLDSTPITWSQSNKVIKEGVGEKSLQLQTGKLGEKISIKVLLQPSLSRPIEKTITIEPQTVDILWEAKTYTPPFYKGKAMFTPQEKVAFIAIPNSTNADGSQIDPRKLTYTWSQDNEILGSLSGAGKATLNYTGNILMHPIETRVQVSSSATAPAENYILLQSTNPELAFYENSPLYGILFNKEVSNSFDFGNKEERTLSLFPYYYGIKSRADSNLTKSWTINYSSIDVPSTQNEMVFRNTENLEGKSFVSAKVKNSKNFFQDSEVSTFINFEKPKKSFSF